MSQGGPIHELRRGRGKAGIWEDDRGPGERGLRVTLGRLYRGGNRWGDSRYFRPEDLGEVGELLADVLAWARAEDEGRATRSGPPVCQVTDELETGRLGRHGHEATPIRSGSDDHHPGGAPSAEAGGGD